MDNLKKFLKHVEHQTEKHNVKLDLPNARSVFYKETECNGYFDDVEKILTVAMLQGSWLELLVHEYSHFEQWRDNAETWTNISPIDGKIDEWLAGKEFSPEQIKDYLVKTRECEHDCDTRALENIKKFNLPINHELYARKANAYIHFHNFLGETRKWYSIGKEPYNVPEILMAMNKTIDADVSTTPENIIELFKKLL